MFLKKIIFTLTFNVSLFLLLIIGIQNSSESRRVNLILKQTVKLPVAFIIGVSFISGSLTGSALTNTFINQKQ
tara:strand:+ start:24 stop:242 length:219 start_codon:yes stop_codon:yes gene_type:complete